MISFEYFIGIVFELFLFFLFSILCYQLFKSQILPIIYQKISSILQYSKTLHEKQNLLKTTSEDLDIKIANEKKELSDISQKIKVWHRAEELSAKQQLKEFELVEKKIKDKQKIQSQNFNLEKIRQEVIPNAILLAYEELSKEGFLKKGQKKFEALVYSLQQQCMKK